MISKELGLHLFSNFIEEFLCLISFETPTNQELQWLVRVRLFLSEKNVSPGIKLQLHHAQSLE